MAELVVKDPKFSEKQNDLSNEINKLRQLAKHDFDLKNNLSGLQKDSHQKRLKNLRDISDKLKDDSWKYPTVQTLLGL